MARMHGRKLFRHGMLVRGIPLLVLPLFCCFVLYGITWSNNGSTPASSRRRGKNSSSSRNSSTNSNIPGEQSTSMAAPSLRNMQTPEECPAWIAEYAEFHRQHRGKPGTKYLVYSACPGSSGLGDRVRGMMYLTRQAIATKRVILFTWRNEPHELETYLPPAGPIDWTLNGIDGYDLPDLDTFCGAASNTKVKSLLPGIEQYEPEPQAVAKPKGGNKGSKGATGIALRVTDYKKADMAVRRYVRAGELRKLAHYQFITIHTNEWLSAGCKGCPDMADPAPKPTQHKDGSYNVDVSSACLYRYLFGVSDHVQDLAQQQLERLYGRQARQPGFQYAAVHMRLGGMEHEASLSSSKGSSNGPLVDLAHGITCINNLGRQVGIDTGKVPVLLFTDHHELRKFIKQGGLTNVITSDVTPTHLARMEDKEAADPESAVSTYVDLVLMARARCAVYSRSGYSMTAWMMGGGTDCYEHYQRGLDRCLSQVPITV